MTDTIPATVKTHTAFIVGNGGEAHGAEFEIRLADDADTYVTGIQWANPGQEEEGYMLSYEQARDITAFIVRACNSHYALLELLQEARSGLCAYTGGEYGACSETIARIDAALSQAGGE